MLPVCLLLAASIVFRLPALLNAAFVDSDSAIVGLQAIHLLHGEWSPFLLGSGYQTSVDSFVAAGFFSVLGPTPLALMLSTFIGHLALTWFAFATLRRHLRPWIAALLVLPLVFTPSPLHTYILGPPRQAALTLVFASVWVLDGAARADRPFAWYAGGAAIASLAGFADPYALVFLPALGALAVLACRDGLFAWTDPTFRRRAGACALGGALGLVPLLLLLSHPQSVHGELGLTRGAIGRNLRLLTGECLPWILSTTAYFSKRGVAYGPWHAPALVRAVQILGGALFVGGFVFAAASTGSRRIPWELRRLGLFGVLVVPVTLVGFLFSVMVMDLFSTRYLAAIVLASPLAFAPAGAILGARRLAASLAPYVLSAALAGWLGFGPFVDGPLPVRTSAAADETRLEEELARRGSRLRGRRLLGLLSTDVPLPRAAARRSDPRRRGSIRAVSRGVRQGQGRRVRLRRRPFARVVRRGAEGAGREPRVRRLRARRRGRSHRGDPSTGDGRSAAALDLRRLTDRIGRGRRRRVAAGAGVVLAPLVVPCTSRAGRSTSPSEGGPTPLPCSTDGKGSPRMPGGRTSVSSWARSARPSRGSRSSTISAAWPISRRLWRACTTSVSGSGRRIWRPASSRAPSAGKSIGYASDEGRAFAAFGLMLVFIQSAVWSPS